MMSNNPLIDIVNRSFQNQKQDLMYKSEFICKTGSKFMIIPSAVVDENCQKVLSMSQEAGM